MGAATSKMEQAKEEARHLKRAVAEDEKKPLPPMEKLPDSIQRVLDDEDKNGIWDSVVEGHASESTDSSVRYAAYASRARTIMLSAHRYVAYTSDIGESFRPIAHPYFVRGAYAISWTYLIGDVAHEGYKAYLRQQALLHPGRRPGEISKRAFDAVAGGEGPVYGHVPAIEDYRAVMAQRAVFQSVASMGLPAFTIHSIVRYSGRAMKDVKNVTLRTWGPIGLGLAAVPFLPYMFDKPVEQAVEWTFHRAFAYVGGPEAVGHSQQTGREQKLTEESKRLNDKKEL